MFGSAHMLAEPSEVVMKALVIFDSFFGNTEQIARAIGAALAGDFDVEVVRVGEFKPEQLSAVQLLIVGSPTRGFRPTPAINSFIDAMPAGGLKGVEIAAFDTRVTAEDVHNIVYTPMAKIFGFAAKPMSDKLARKSGHITVPPEGFVVAGEKGPLKEGELERAAAWARQIVASQRVAA
jgi:flavodoxin I